MGSPVDKLLVVFRLLVAGKLSAITRDRQEITIGNLAAELTAVASPHLDELILEITLEVANHNGCQDIFFDLNFSKSLRKPTVGRTCHRKISARLGLDDRGRLDLVVVAPVAVVACSHFEMLIAGKRNSTDNILCCVN